MEICIELLEAFLEDFIFLNKKSNDSENSEMTDADSRRFNLLEWAHKKGTDMYHA